MSAETLTAKTVKGLQWSYIDTAVNVVMQIGYTSIMARLLSPADFGLVAMGGVVLRFGSYFAQMGMGPALVQKNHLYKEDIRAGFTSSVLLSSVMFCLAWVIAPFAVYIFNDPALVPIVRAMALSFVFTGLSTTALSLLRRNLNFRAIAFIDIVSYVLGYGLGGIGLGLMGFGVWSLIAASLSQSALVAILAYLLTRHSVRFVFGWVHFKPLYSFGSRVSLIGFLEFLGANLDTLIIGRFLGPATLGIYNRAWMLINLPMEYLATGFSKVLMPSYSRLQSDTPRMRNAYLTSIMLMGSLFIPICWGVAAGAQEIVLVLLGEQWRAAIPVLQILAFATPFSLLSHLAGALMEARAALNPKIFIQVASLAVLCLLLFLLGRFGVIGFALAMTIEESMRFVAYTFAINGFLRISKKRTFSAYSPAVISGLIVAILIFLTAFVLRQNAAPVWLTLLAEICVGAIALAVQFLLADWQAPNRATVGRVLLSSDVRPAEHSLAFRVLAYFGILSIEPT